jgi:hypothetical protein
MKSPMVFLVKCFGLGPLGLLGWRKKRRLKCSSSRLRREGPRIKIAISIGGAIIFASLLTGGEAARAAACGALNQRPCKVFERVPSCNRGLFEDFRHGRCIAKPAGRLAPPHIAKPNKPPPSCGALNQRPCRITERIPSCNRGLIEDFRHGRCITKPAGRLAPPHIAKPNKPPPSCGALNQRPCRITERIPSCNRGLIEDFRHGRCITKAVPRPGRPPPGHPISGPPHHLQCGAVNQRACKLTERIPSCDRNLVERHGTCIRLTNCGAEGQRPCKITERIPSCNVGLADIRGKCTHSVCGSLNMRACKIVERIPSCDKGLRESHGKCIRLKPGEIAVLATIGEFSANLAATGKNECIKLLDHLPAPSTTVMHVHLSAEAAKYFSIGFTCAILGDLDQISGYTGLAQEMNLQFHKPPCAKWLVPVRPICTIFQSTFVVGGATAGCLVDLAKEKLITGRGGNSSVRETWLGIGGATFAVANMVKSLADKKKKDKNGDKGKKGKDGKNNEGKDGKNGKESAKDSDQRKAMDYVLKGFGLQIKYTAAADQVLNGPLCRGIQ